MMHHTNSISTLLLSGATGGGGDSDRLRVSCHHHKLKSLGSWGNRKWRLKIIGTEISRTDQSAQLGTDHLQGRTMNLIVLVKVISMHI